MNTPESGASNTGSTSTEPEVSPESTTVDNTGTITPETEIPPVENIELTTTSTDTEITQPIISGTGA